MTTISDARKRQATTPPIVGHAAILADLLKAAHAVRLPMPRSADLCFGVIDLQVGPDDLRAWIDWTCTTPKTPRLLEGSTHFRAEGTLNGVPLVLRAVRLGEES